jgi:phasin
MLSLWFRSFWWAAWWPVSTWLLMLQKAAGQMPAGFAPPQPRDSDRGPVGGQETHNANDAFMKPELPQSLRELMKISIEQARRAFEAFAATSEKTWQTMASGSITASAGMRALNEKIAEITRSNANANFALALKLAESKDLGLAMELQAEHARKQMDAFVRQLEEMRDLATKVIQDSTPTRTPGAGGGIA